MKILQQRGCTLQDATIPMLSAYEYVSGTNPAFLEHGERPLGSGSWPEVELYQPFSYQPKESWEKPHVHYVSSQLDSEKSKIGEPMQDSNLVWSSSSKV